MTPPLADGVIDEATTGETVQFHAANTIEESDHNTLDGAGRRAGTMCLDTATTRRAGATSRRRCATVTIRVRDALDDTASHRRATSLVVAAPVHHATNRRRAAIIMIATVRVGARSALDATTCRRPARSLVVATMARRAGTAKIHHGAIFTIATAPILVRNMLDATTTRVRAMMGNDTLAITANNQACARHHQRRHHASNRSSGVN